MKVKAIARFQRVSPRKVKRILNLIRGKSAHESLSILNFLPHAGAKLIYETLKSAVANAKNNNKLDVGSLVVSECHAGPSTPMKRFRCGPRGRGMAILKRTSNITIYVEAR